MCLCEIVCLIVASQQSIICLHTRFDVEERSFVFPLMAQVCLGTLIWIAAIVGTIKVTNQYYTHHSIAIGDWLEIGQSAPTASTPNVCQHVALCHTCDRSDGGVYFSDRGMDFFDWIDTPC